MLGAGGRCDRWQSLGMVSSILQRAAELMVPLPSRRAMGMKALLSLRDELFTALKRRIAKTYTPEGFLLREKELRLTKRMIPRVFLGNARPEERASRSAFDFGHSKNLTVEIRALSQWTESHFCHEETYEGLVSALELCGTVEGDRPDA